MLVSIPSLTGSQLQPIRSALQGQSDKVILAALSAGFNPLINGESAAAFNDFDELIVSEDEVSIPSLTGSQLQLEETLPDGSVAKRTFQSPH